MRIWQCPGPSRLVAGIVEDVIDGKPVLLTNPRLAPDGVEQELATGFGLLGYRLIILEDCGQSPARQVLEAAYADEDMGRELRADDLIGHSSLDGLVFLFWIADRASLSRWADFLSRLSIARRASPDREPPRIVLSLKGDLASGLKASATPNARFVDVGDAVTHVDLLLLAYHEIGGSHGASLKGDLIAQTAASLAIWDYQLLVRLLDESMDRLFNPLPVLQDYAAELGWCASTQKTRHEGIVRTAGGREQVHSAYVALSDPAGVVPSRVWAGQAAVLLPAIEQRRQELIAQGHRYLQPMVPLRTEYEVITSVHDLEIGQVCHLLKKQNAPPNLQSQALRLMLARNRLAHLEPLTAADACSQELVGT